MKGEPMKALALTDFDSAPSVQEVARPEPGPGDVLVRVKAAALNGIDVAIASGMVKGMAEYRFPVVIGCDGAGIVDALGERVGQLAVGEEVLGNVPFSETLREGTIAEYALFPVDLVVAKPAGLPFVEAAALPLAGTAALAVVEAAELQRGQTVVIAGAGGGVGSFAIQLAAGRGATVIATGLPADADRLRGLGASTVVNYHEDVAAQVLADHPDGVDALIDLVSFDPDSFGSLAKAVRRGGKVANTTPGATPAALETAGLTGQMIVAPMNRETLTTILAQVESGELRIDVEQVLPLDQAATGLTTMNNRTARGKITIAVDS
jgi:NADPH:quinone reductase-like Zn-dependent oxidoreductase